MPIGMVKRYLHRHQPAKDARSWMKSGIGAALAMGIVGGIGAVSHEPLLIAPFDAP